MKRLLIAVLTIVVLTPTVASAREWTDASGLHTVEAEFVKLEKNTVHIRTSDGRIVPIGLQNLSKADQQHVQAVVEASKPRLSPTKALPGVRPVGDEEIKRTLAAMQWESTNRDAATAVLVLAPPLTMENLQQLQQIDRAVRQGKLWVGIVATNDPKLFAITEAALKGRNVRCNGNAGDRCRRGNYDFHLFVGLMNSEEAAVTPDESKPSHEALEQLITVSLNAGCDAYVFPGAEPWKPNLDAGNWNNLVTTCHKNQRVIWLPQVPKDRTFADFVSIPFDQRFISGNRGLADLVDPFDAKE
jgi:SLA1 Homology Domain 1 (SHD1) protein